MTSQNRTTLKALLEDGDTFDSTIAGDMVDSALNLTDTTAQSMSSDLTSSKFIATTEVSAIAVKASSVNASIVSGAAVKGAVVSGGTGAFDALTLGGDEILAAGKGASASLYITGTATQDIAGAGTFIAVSGTFAAGSHLVEFSARADGGLKYSGPAVKHFHANAHMSIGASGNAKMSSLRVGVDSSSIATSEIDRYIATGGDLGAMSMGTIVSADTSAVFQVFVANKTDTTNLEIQKMIFVVHQV